MMNLILIGVAMRITTRGAVLIGVVAILLANGESLGAKAKAQAERSASRARTNAIASSQTEAAKAAAKLSIVALERAKICKPVVDSKTMKPMVFVEGQAVNAGVGVAIRMTKRIVCNTVGDTAYVNEAGVIQEGSIASVTAEDLPKFQAILRGEKTNDDK
jgi:hypothetical protein